MSVFIFPGNMPCLINHATGIRSRCDLIRNLLARMRAEEVFGTPGCRFFTVQNSPPPLNTYGVSPGGFLYLACEWLPPKRLRAGRKVPTVILSVQTSWGSLATRRFIPAWLVYALATDGTHASRILTFAYVAKQYVEALDAEVQVLTA